MAYFRKVKNGWRAEVERAGVRRTATRPTKAEAQAWAVAEEAAILAGTRGEYPSRTLAEAVARYRVEVTDKKPAGVSRADNLRFDAWLRDYPDLAGKTFHKITGEDLAAWRDARLKLVSGSSVLREAQQFRPIWTLAVRQWKWAGQSPWKDIKLPTKGHARRRVGGWEEIRLILRSAGTSPRVAPRTPQQEAAWAMLIALATSLRSGEILRMSTTTVDLKRKVYELRHHKTEAVVGARRVPLPGRAVRLLRVLEAQAVNEKRESYFTISDASRDTLYRKLRDRTMVKGLRFHDLRATALTMLSKRVDVMTLAKISGHKNINELFNTYYRETEEAIAARL
ncbi:tyrosine-type recombinase/integrase [Comamonas antarctica]|uniref:Tyrosine-type recombinase/integrase n=1 Tax=Comamonas antarctica TaxID=2743470 RepID=A0A6N1X4A5_9BURK|nr:tyrosine-type recombinase/integrase [Comamonas antarctica]QKV52615.1 tyrosine-type recombinase/integrase [Comamonas antarctica]